MSRRRGFVAPSLGGNFLRIPTLFWLFSTLGCATLMDMPEFPDETKFHQIAVNRDGDYLPLYDNKNSDIQCPLESHIDSIMDAIRAGDPSPNGKKKILLSVHGGLNSLKDNFERVEQHYLDILGDGYYPIFVSWRSGALTTLKDRYFRVRNGVDRPLNVTLPSLPFYLTTDLAKGISAIPESFWDQGANFINTQNNHFFNGHEADICDFKEKFSVDQNPEMGIHFIYSGRGEDKPFLNKASYFVRQIFPGTIRLISTPLIEGMAEKAWNIMLGRCQDRSYRKA